MALGVDEAGAAGDVGPRLEVAVEVADGDDALRLLRPASAERAMSRRAIAPPPEAMRSIRLRAPIDVRHG